MSRSGPGFPAWAFAGFWLGIIVGIGTGYLLAVVADHDNPNFAMVLAALTAGGCAAGGAVVGGVRDALAYAHRRFPPTDAHSFAAATRKSSGWASARGSSPTPPP